jgi:hypothetical protein
MQALPGCLIYAGQENALCISNLPYGRATIWGQNLKRAVVPAGLLSGLEIRYLFVESCWGCHFALAVMHADDSHVKRSREAADRADVCTIPLCYLTLPLLICANDSVEMLPGGLVKPIPYPYA